MSRSQAEGAPWAFTCAQSEAKNSAKLTFVNTKDFSLRYSTGLMKESSIGMKELAPASTFVLRFGSLDLLGGAGGDA